MQFVWANTRTVTYTIENDGGVPLIISGIISSNPDFAVSGIPATIPAMGSGTFDVTYTANSLGTHNATITIDNNDPDDDPYTFLMEVLTNPLPVPGLTSTATMICAGDNVDFTASATGGTTPYQYEFFVNGGSVQGPSPVTIYSTTTLVDGDVVTVTATDANGCLDTHAGITMTVYDNPIAGLTSTATAICAGDNVDFTASATSGTTPFPI